jgi:hypothetical protein
MRQQNDLPPLFFMSRKEKIKFFEETNKSFHANLLKEPQRSSKTKKIVKFRQNFDVKPFSDKQKVVVVSKTSTFSDDYRN